MLASAHADRTRELHGGSLSPLKAASLGQLGRAAVQLPQQPPQVQQAGDAAAANPAGSSSSSASGGGGAAGYTGNAAQLAAMLAQTPSYTAVVGQSSASRSAARAAARAASSAAGEAPPTVEIDSVELETIFHAYCAFGTTARLADEMDSARFAKLARENGITDGVGVTGAAVDLAFSKALDRARCEAVARNSASRKPGNTPRARRTLQYRDFQQALALLAPQRFPELEMVAALQALVEGIIHSGGPAYNNVAVPKIGAASVFAKLTDTALYTAASRARFSGED